MAAAHGTIRTFRGVSPSPNTSKSSPGFKIASMRLREPRWSLLAIRGAGEKWSAGIGSLALRQRIVLALSGIPVVENPFAWTSYRYSYHEWALFGRGLPVMRAIGEVCHLRIACSIATCPSNFRTEEQLFNDELGVLLFARRMDRLVLDTYARGSCVAESCAAQLQSPLHSHTPATPTRVAFSCVWQLD